MAKQRKQRQQPSKKKVQVKQKIARQDSANTFPAKKFTDVKLPEDAKHICVYGLNNLGNTCFYNSALQVLVSVPMLRDFCLEMSSSHHLRLGPIGLALQELVQTVYGQRELSQAQSAKVSKLLQREGNPVFSPSRLLAAICKVAPQFKGGQQQDSHELLGKLIEGMLAEEVRAAKALQEQEGGSGEPDRAAAPMTEALFGGVLSSQVICDDCGHKAVTLEPFYNLSLPIPSKLRADPGAQATTKRRMKRIAKKEKGGNGKPAMELPNSSMPAQEQAKLGSKQDKKREKEEKKAGKPARRRAQKQAAAAQAGTEDAEAAGEGYREPFPSLADSNEGSGTSKLQEPTAEGSVAPVGQPKGRLLGGRADSDSDSDHSSVTSLGPGLAGVDIDLTDSAGTQMAYLQAHPAPLTATSLSEDTELPQGSGHLASGIPLGQPEYVSPAEDTLAGRMPGNNLQSETCVSRDADTLTMNAGEQTECPQRTQAAAMQARQSLVASGLASGLTSEQPSTHLQKTGRQRHRSTGQMTDLSAQMHAASLAPDAKSAAAPVGAAHSHGSSEDEGESSPLGSQSTSDRRRSMDSTRSMDCGMPPCSSSSNVALLREGSGETSPPLGWQLGCPQPGCGQPAMRLLGGGADTWEGDMLDANGSSGWTHLGHDGKQKGSSRSSSQPTLGKAVLDASTQQKAAADATDAGGGMGLDSANGGAQQDAFSAAESAERGAEVVAEGLGTGQDEGQDLVRETSLGSISAASSVTNADVALYDSLDTLRGEPPTMNDLSSESEEDAVVAAVRLKLCEFPVEGTAERDGEAGPAQPEEEEEGHVEDAPEEEGLSEDASEEKDEALPHEESAAASSEAEEPQKQVTLEGCLMAFFAKEDVTWACPAEGKLLSRAHSSGEPGRELASPSMDVATPEACEKLKRRSVSFSEEAPRVKFIPGSAEQRGTNFVLALSGERPFCRPLKHGGAYFLLTAEVDGERKDAIFLGLQGQDESDETKRALESCNAIGGAIEFTSVSIDPIKDPADEEEQAKVMSQAQALLDCVADLIVHCGVLSTVDILQEGVQLSRRTSLDCPADSWRISGHAPSPDGAAPWEYPPATAEASTSPRPKGDEVYVPREPIGRHSPSSTDAESPLTTLKSRLWAFHQPIPEGGSGSSTSASLSLGSTTGEAAQQLRNDLPKGLAGQAKQSEAPDGLELGAASDASMAGGTKQPSALSAALSEGSGASSLQQGQGEQAANGHHLPAAPNRDAQGGTQDAAAGTQPEEHVHSAPRSIPGSGRHLGRPRQLRAGHSAGLSASPAGVNSSTGTAMFWTGSQALGIAFADDNESQDSERNAAGQAREEGHEMAHSPLQAKAKAFGVTFEDSASGGASSQGNDSLHAGANGPVVKGARDDSSNVAEPSAREALEERAREDVRQQSISDVAAAAVAEVDAEKAEQEGDEQQQEQRHAQAAGSLSGELPPGDTLSERGSVDEEREGLSVSPDLRHLKSVPELAKASPEASRPDAPLSSSPITLSPLHGTRWKEAPEGSPAADRTPVPSRQGSSRINSMERVTRSILRNKVAGPIKRRAVKGYLVHRAPEALMLHLKRFQQDLSGRLRKIDGPVPFPRELDLSPFCDPEGKDAGGAQYSLVGVVEHQGSMAGGHYISYSARLPDGQPAQPASSLEPALETTARANGPTKAATPKKAGTSKGAQQNGPVPNGKAKSGNEAAKQGGGGDKGTASAADEGLKKAAKELHASLAASRKSFDAEKMLWFRASDSHVKLVSWEQVAACEPYLLMYVRTE